MPALVVREAGDRHEAPLGLDDEVVARPGSVGPVRTVAADGQVDEVAVQPSQGGVVEPQAGEPPDPKVLDQDVRTLEEATQHLAATVDAQVEPERALIAIDRCEVGRDARLAARACATTDPGRTPASAGITFGRLDLDDVGTEVAKQHGA